MRHIVIRLFEEWFILCSVTMSRVVAVAQKPLLKIVAAANLRISTLEGPLKQHIVRCDATGEDLTAAVWNEYKTCQLKLLQYRREKLWDEAAYLFSGSAFSFATLTYKDIIIGLRIATKCLALFLIFTMIARGTVFPLVEPTSPFMQQIDLLQPNFRRRLNIAG